MLTHDRLLDVLRYNKETGKFTWLKRLAPRGKIGAEAGSYSAAGNNRLEIRIDGRLHLGHRLAWFYINGVMPPSMIDHIDGDPSNNRWANLRCASVSENNYNRKKQAGKTSSWKGVSWNSERKEWACQVQKNRRHVHRSYHLDERDAAETYIFAALEAFGEFARFS